MCGSSSLIGMWDPIAHMRGEGCGLGFWGCVFLYGTGGPRSLTTNHTVLSSFLFRSLSAMSALFSCHMNQYIDKKNY